MTAQRQAAPVDDAMNKGLHRQLIIFVCTVCLLMIGNPVQAATMPINALQERIGFVDKLLNDSSAARQVKESDVAAAKELRGRAIDRYAAALQAFESGNYELVEAGLTEAIKSMYAAVSATQQGGVATEKSDRDFRNRRASVEALLEADRRIAEEKGRRKEHELLRQEIALEISQADELLAAGESAPARHHLDLAYDKVKTAIEQLREGDTLVRELKFETKKDEYLYELDRNDTHKMLISVLLDEKLRDNRIRERVMPLLSRAEELRDAAKLQARHEKFSEAVATLEQSTRELVRAIRGAGIYIPG